MTRPFLVWCLLRDQQGHVQPVERAVGDRARFEYDSVWSAERMLDASPDVVLCVNDYHSEVALCLLAARRAGIPSLTLQDGILEWRCQFENPLFGNGGGAPQHQPVLADWIACLGAQSARQIAAWGNADKVLVTGMPRLDELASREHAPPRRPGRRLLVMTAKNPGFTPAQREVTIHSLRALASHLRGRPDLEVSWRVSRGVAEEIGVPHTIRTLGGSELEHAIADCDAVVSTPSTAMLEAMLMGRPVAALDFHNVPRFVPTAWTINAPDHMAPVIGELLDPPARRLAHQREILHDCLAHPGRASEEVAAVMLDLAAGRKPRKEATAERSAAPLSELYPDQSIFRERDVEELQVLVARLQRENATLREAIGAQRIDRRLLALGRRMVGRLASH